MLGAQGGGAAQRVERPALARVKVAIRADASEQPFGGAGDELVIVTNRLQQGSGGRRPRLADAHVHEQHFAEHLLGLGEGEAVNAHLRLRGEVRRAPGRGQRVLRDTQRCQGHCLC